MEITSFTRIVWKKDRENINKHIASASRLLNECEYLTVVKQQRQATTYHVDLENLSQALERFNSSGLVFTPCKRSGFYQGFAHKHKAVKLGDPYYWFGCVTRTHEEGMIFKEAEKSGDHTTIGKMLGYPECCIEYFKENFPKNYDPVWLNDNDVPDGEAVANILLRYFGIRIISHLACSPHCEGSIKVGRERLEIIREIDLQAADWLLEFLAMPMTWNSYHGVVEVDTPNFLGLTHTFPMDKPRIIKWRYK